MGFESYEVKLGKSVCFHLEFLHLAAAPGEMWQGWFWEPALLLGVLGQGTLEISSMPQTFPCFPCVGQSITISPLSAGLGRGVGEWEEVLLSTQCCAQHSNLPSSSSVTSQHTLNYNRDRLWSFPKCLVIQKLSKCITKLFFLTAQVYAYFLTIFLYCLWQEQGRHQNLSLIQNLWTTVSPAQRMWTCTAPGAEPSLL